MFLKNFEELQKILPCIFGRQFYEETFIVVPSNYITIALYILKTHIHYQYKMLSCISGVDLLDDKYRFCVCFDILSFNFNIRLRLKTFISEKQSLISSTSVYENANWWEREVWDLFGIFFEKHQDLRRLLTDYGFEGYPMRKDFPLFGFIELRYSESKKRVIAEQIQLAQEFRFFNFETPW